MRSYIKNVLKKYDLKPKKSLGQNFLINSKTYETIVEAGDIKREDEVIEIGAGIGTLTEAILKAVGKDGKIIAIEKDSHLTAILEDIFKDSPNVIIEENDVLKFNPEGKVQDGGYKIVGNIPYYLTSHLLRIIFEKWPKPNLIVLLIQKEVAKRIVAQPPKSNILAVSVQYFSQPEIIEIVGKKKFWPEPGVDSAIIKLKINDKKRETKEFDKRFFEVVRAGFSKKRKQLINSLSGGLKISKSKVEIILKNSKINQIRRAETLTISEWKKITKIYSSLR